MKYNWYSRAIITTPYMCAQGSTFPETKYSYHTNGIMLRGAQVTHTLLVMLREREREIREYSGTS